MTESLKTLTITCRDAGDHRTWEESFDAETLIDPRDVGRRRAHPDVRVRTGAEAETWARALVDAFNATRRSEREPRRLLVRCALFNKVS